MSRTKGGLRARRAPQQTRSEETVAVLLDAAREVLGREGFAATTMSEVARTAGVTPSAVYRYFPSKAALLAALVRRDWEEEIPRFAAAFSVLPTTMPFAERVEESVKMVFDMIARRIATYGQVDFQARHVLDIDAGAVEKIARLVAATIEPLPDFEMENRRAAALLVVRAVIFLSRVGVRDYPDLVENGVWRSELARLVSRYLVGG